MKAASKSTKAWKDKKAEILDRARQPVIDYVSPYGLGTYGDQSPISTYLTIWGGSVVKGNKSSIFSLRLIVNESDPDLEPRYSFSSGEGLSFSSEYKKEVQNKTFTFDELAPILDNIIIEYGNPSDQPKVSPIWIGMIVILILALVIGFSS